MTEEGSDRPVGGAMVVLTDAAGTPVDASITDDSGAARLTAAGSGPWRLVVERIGYRTVAAGPLDLSGPPPQTVRIRAPVEPIQLAAIEARSDAVCRPDRTGPRSAALLWEESRKALERVLWTRAREDYRFDVALIERRRAQGGRVLSETPTRTVATGFRPFRAAEPEWLAERGFVHLEDDFPVFYGPDAEVLLSDAFADTHCFYVRRDADRGRIGLAFEPIHPDRDEITGTLWLDAQTAALLEIEYDYVGPLVETNPRRPEGFIHLRELPDGGWIVDHWWIRQPVYIRRPGGLRRFSGWFEKEGRVEAIDPPSGADVEEP